MTHRPKDPAILSDPMAQAWRRGELSDGVMLTPQPMTDNDDLRDRVAKALEAFDLSCKDEGILTPDERAGFFQRAADAALSATPIESLQQRVERLEVALRRLLSSYIGTCRFNGRVISEIEQHHCVIDARAALGDDVG